MNLEAYLKRIDLHGVPLEPTLEVLNAVQRAHLNAILYENLDIHLGRELPLGAAQAFEKIVVNGRGGWCYEMNALLGWALTEIGFEVQLLSSGVLRPGGTTPDGDHLILLVLVNEEPYLADAGFGDGAIEAIPLREGTYERGFLTYGIERDGQSWIMRNPAQSNTAGFVFTVEARGLNYFAGRCTNLQTSPESGFVRTTVCQRITDTALYTLRGAILTTLTAHKKTERTLEDADDYRTTLRETFKLELPETEQLWERISARHLEWVSETQT
jgi:N-hydroxyarylamine O-acetyltransferase